MSAGEPKTQQHFERAKQRIEDQHSKLHRMRGEVEATFSSGSMEDIRLAVNGFSGAVEVHFELEEQAYYPAPSDVDADASANLASLAADHERLREELVALRDLVKTGDLGEVARAFETFAHDLTEHEAREEATMEAVVLG